MPNPKRARALNVFPADSLHLEALTTDNAGDAAALHAKCFARSWPFEDFRNYAEGTRCYSLLARLEQETVGGLVIARAGGDEGEILTIATAPGLRRKGIAGKLLSSIIERLAGAGIAIIFLEVGVTNKAAIALYTSFGFETIGKRAAYYNHANSREDALIMRRLLGDFSSI